MKLAVQLSDLVVAFPAPTLLAGSPFEVRSGHGRLVVRTPKIREFGDIAILEFDELPGGWKANGPFGGAKTTVIRRLRGISTLDEAKAHFFLEHEQTVKAAFENHADAVSCTKNNESVIVTFSFAKAGWEPGNSVVYVVPKNGDGAVLFDPTHHMEYDWAHLSVERTGAARAKR